MARGGALTGDRERCFCWAAGPATRPFLRVPRRVWLPWGSPRPVSAPLPVAVCGSFRFLALKSCVRHVVAQRDRVMGHDSYEQEVLVPRLRSGGWRDMAA